MSESSGHSLVARVPLVLAPHDALGVERAQAAEDLVLLERVIESGSSAVGGSIATKARIWKRCVTTMSRKAPASS